VGWSGVGVEWRGAILWQEDHPHLHPHLHSCLLTCTCRLLRRLRQLTMPPAGPHPQVVHQNGAPLQLEPKLALQAEGALAKKVRALSLPGRGS